MLADPMLPESPWRYDPIHPEAAAQQHVLQWEFKVSGYFLSPMICPTAALDVLGPPPSKTAMIFVRPDGDKVYVSWREPDVCNDISTPSKGPS